MAEAPAREQEAYNKGYERGRLDGWREAQAAGRDFRYPPEQQQSSPMRPGPYDYSMGCRLPLNENCKIFNVVIIKNWGPCAKHTRQQHPCYPNPKWRARILASFKDVEKGSTAPMILTGI